MTPEKVRRTRLAAKLLREVLAGERFADRGSAKEALKLRLARLRIPYDVDVVEGACDLLESHRTLTEAACTTRG